MNYYFCGLHARAPPFSTLNLHLYMSAHGHKYTGSVTQNHKAQLANAYNELGKELSSSKIRVIGKYTLGKVIGEGTSCDSLLPPPFSLTHPLTRRVRELEEGLRSPQVCEQEALLAMKIVKREPVQNPPLKLLKGKRRWASATDPPGWHVILLRFDSCLWKHFPSCNVSGTERYDSEYTQMLISRWRVNAKL